MAKKRGLGRGLDALLSSVTVEEEVVALGSDSGPAPEGYRFLALDRIQRGAYQPRRDMDPEALEELADSIRSQGLLQPIVVRPVDGERYEIIAGERRWRAAHLAQLGEIPVMVKDVPDEAASAMALIENIQREDLNPMEEAVALQRLVEEFELTQQRVAELVGKSRSTVTNLLRLNGLQEEVKRLLQHGDLEMGHARALLPLEASAQVELARDVAARGLTVRQTEELVRRAQLPVAKKQAPASFPEIEQLQERLCQSLGARVKIAHSETGKGKVTIPYTSAEELEALLKRIG